MENLQVHFNSNIEARNFLATLKPREVEYLFRESAALFRRQKPDSKETKINKLLQKINACVLPDSYWPVFQSLIEKREDEILTEKEALQLEAMIDEEEELRLERLKLLAKLANLKGISLMDAIKELGIRPLEYA